MYVSCAMFELNEKKLNENERDEKDLQIVQNI